MTLSPRLRKVALAAHVTTSVGWLGAVVAFLALAVAGVVSQDASAVSAAYLAMDVTGWFVLVPLALSSLLTGLLQSLGTNWGLFRHYWVVIKLAITVLATVVLLLYMQTLGTLADAARESATGNSDIEDVRSASPLVHAGAALVLLVTATVLAVFKPVGMTAYARRRRIRPEP
jgi:hypothetical protein